jgi:hypothetical protein
VAPDPWKHLNAVRRHRCGSRTEAPETWAPNGQQRTDRNDRLWMQCLRMNQKQRTPDSNAGITVSRLLQRG